MKFKKIRIENFKGIEKVEIDLVNNRILTLVGLNESGKTTILESIKQLYNLLRDIKLTPKQINELRPKGIDFTGDILLETDMELDETDIEKIRKFAHQKDPKLKLEIPKNFNYTFKYNFEVHTYKKLNKTCGFPITITNKSNKKLHDFRSSLWSDIISYVRVNLTPEVLYYEDFIFEIPDRIVFKYEEDIEEEDNEDTENKEWRMVFDDILKTVSDKFTNFQENVIDIWKTDNDTARQRLSAMEKQLDKKITTSWKELFESDNSKDSQRLNFKELKLIPITNDNEIISFSFKVRTDSGKEYSLNERSKGCKWFFSFLIFTEFRKNRTKNIIFLLDEPASNLHSSAQLKILNAIHSLSDKSIVIYSTHSHHLINPEWLNGAYVVINEGLTTGDFEGALTDADAKIIIDKYFNYVSQKHQQSQTLYFQPILDRLDYKTSLLEPLPELVITEGKFDWYTFKYLNEVILNKKFNLNFYPGKGANSNDEIIRLSLAWGTNFIHLLDSDKKGVQSQKDYLKRLGDIIENKIFTYKNLLNKEIMTEDLFSEKDKTEIVKEAFGNKEISKKELTEKNFKSTFNYAISQLLIQKKPVQIEKNTIKEFENIFSKLNEKLVVNKK